MQGNERFNTFENATILMCDIRRLKERALNLGCADCNNYFFQHTTLQLNNFQVNRMPTLMLSVNAIHASQ